jgi:hypothetical protein
LGLQILQRLTIKGGTKMPKIIAIGAIYKRAGIPHPDLAVTLDDGSTKLAHIVDGTLIVHNDIRSHGYNIHDIEPLSSYNLNPCGMDYAAAIDRYNAQQGAGETECFAFSASFQRARLAAKLTQRGIEDLLGIPYRTVQSWEGGINTPPEWAQRLILAELARIAENK